MTLYSGEESPAAFVARMRAEHGLPPKCGDAAVLGRIARELADALLSTNNENGTSATEPRSRHTTDHPSSKEKANDNST